MSDQYPRQNPFRKFIGIILLAISLIVIASVILVSYIALGAVFSGFDPMAAKLATAPAAVYAHLVTGSFTALALMGSMIIIAGVIIVIFAIYRITEGGRGEY
jgi:hypothetical protein